jgi:hypothetical protein
LRVLGVLLFLVGAGLLGLAAWWIYRPACPAAVGVACLHFARMAFKEARA